MTSISLDVIDDSSVWLISTYEIWGNNHTKFEDFILVLTGVRDTLDIRDKKVGIVIGFTFGVKRYRKYWIDTKSFQIL
jgi:hypothetical protein